LAPEEILFFEQKSENNKDTPLTLSNVHSQTKAQHNTCTYYYYYWNFYSFSKYSISIKNVLKYNEINVIKFEKEQGESANLIAF